MSAPLVASLDNAGLGPCEVHDPLWAKMSSAVTGPNKKRKKPDTKPQAQINKCLNEKRRREEENIRIEELAELISARFADMSSLSVKPDKCAILQETVNQIRLIKEQEAEAGNEAVQQGEVSSSKPTILANDILGPLLLEALEGFLFVVNPEGRVEYVTENVSQFIRFRKDEVLGNSIYNYLHHGDHGRFSSSLLPTTAVGWVDTPPPPSQQPQQQQQQSSATATLIVSQQQQQQQQPTRNRAFNCRFLIKPPDDTDETMEEKQQRVSKYENMQISSTQLPYPGGGGSGDKGGGGGDEGGSGDSGEVGPCLMCVARRIPPNEKHLGSPLEQFTIKLDTLGNVVGIDTSGVSSAYSQFLNKDLMNKSIKDLCHRHDRSKLNSHVNEVVASGQSISAIYRLRVSLAQEKYIHVQAKSKLFKGTCSPHDNDFIMSTHSILGDVESPGEAASPLGLGGSQSSGGGGGGSVGGAGGSSVGGPLLSNLNGSGRGNSGVTSSELSASPSMNSSAAVAFSTGVTLSNSDLGFEFVDLFPSSTWDTMMTGGGDGGNGNGGGGGGGDSRNLTPAQSPLNPFPVAGGQVSSPAPPSTPSFAPTPSSFPFSPLQDGPTADVKEEVSSEVSVESARLRNLLMTKRPSTDTSADESPPPSHHHHHHHLQQHHHHHQRNNKHNILKGLLNQEDDDSHHHHADKTPTPTSAAPSTANNMLLKLLNEKSDDDDVEARAGLKKQNELLQQLLKEDESNQENDDPLFKNLVFRTSGGSPGSGGNNSMDSVGRARKRPSEEGDDSGGGVGSGGGGSGGAKRSSGSAAVAALLDSLPPSSGAGSNPGGGSSTSSGGNSKLWEKNKMLASLLAKQPSTPATIPPIPASVISATPQDKLPRLIKQSQSTGWCQQSQSQSQQQQQQSQQQQQQQQQIALRLGQQQQQVAQQQLGSALRQTVVPTGGSGGGNSTVVAVAPYSATQQQSWDSSDPVLSDLLDQVIETLPETVADSPALIINMMNSIDSPNSSGSSTSFQQDLNEKMAINAIQKSLMQCETAVKSPAYTTTALGQQGQQQFTPPPMYPQRQRFPIQGPLAGRQPNHQFSLANQQQLLLQQQQQKQRLMQAQQQQQQQQKQRLLQQQQQQQLLIPSNAAVAAASASTGDPAAIHNIDSLINNTVAPNVSLQRSGSVPDSQLSPVGVGGFGGTGGGGAGGSSGAIINSAASQISPGQRQPYSPQPFSPVNSGGINSFQSTTGQQGAQQARLSPSGLPNFQQAQLSPRVSQGQQVYTSQGQTNSWSQQQANRISLQQQQNPMLNAQLTGGSNAGSGAFAANSRGGFATGGAGAGGGNGGGSNGGGVAAGGSGGQVRQTLPPVRSLTSPGSRQSPFPPELSPTTATSYQLRLQRTLSGPPQATTQLPGGCGLRHFGKEQQHHLQHQLQQQHHHHQHHLQQPPPLPPHYPHHHHHYPPPPQSAPSSPTSPTSSSGAGPPPPLLYPPPPSPHHPSHHFQQQQPPPPPQQQQQPTTPQQQQQQQFCFGQNVLQLYGGGGSPAAANSAPRHTPPGGNNGMTEYVRQELRAMVGARTGGSSGGGGGSGGGANTVGGGSRLQQQQQQPNTQQQHHHQLQLLPGQQVSSADLEALGLSFDMNSPSDSPKLWSNLSDLGSSSPQPGSALSARNSLEEVSRSNDQKSSLLQKLLSE